MRKRSIRRHHKARLLKKLKRDGYHGLVSDGNRSSVVNVMDHHRRNVNNPKKCSCFMCGNPRKWSKGDESLTLQERKAQQFHSDYIRAHP